MTPRTNSAPKAGTPHRAPLRTYLLAVVAGLSLTAIVVGLLAWNAPAHRGVAILVGIAMCGPVALSLSWAVFVAPHTVVADRHQEDNVERQWLERAAVGTLTDLLLLTGVGAGALSLSGLGRTITIPIDVALLAGAVFLVVDTGLRLVLIRHRALG